MERAKADDLEVANNLRDIDSGILFDHARLARINLPEAVFCQGKSLKALEKLLATFANESAEPILFTRLEAEIFAVMPESLQKSYDYHALSRTAFAKTMPKRNLKAKVAIVSAGTADAFVTWEVARTLTYLGINYEMFEDCGVAGLWRLLEKLEAINSCDVIVVVAGLEAALLSVLGGLSPRPIIGVPTSVGYGVSASGQVAMLSMLASCAPGLPILNIDNGYGAACAAARILKDE